MTVTQEMITNLAGMRREGVNQAAGKLHEEELIHCSSGKITVLFRPKAEARICECYTVVNRECDHLLSKITAAQGRQQAR